MAETFFYMTTTGRKSGKAHQIEIWYVEYQNCWYLCSEHREQADWVQNIMQQPQVRFAIGEREQPRTEHAGQAVVVTDDAIITEIAARFQAKYDWSDGLFVQICPEG